MMDFDGVAVLAATATGYDDLGRVVQMVTDPDDASLAYTGQKLTTSHGYDKAGRQVTLTDPNLNVTTYHYDTASRLDIITDALPAPGQIHLSYDNSNRITALENPRQQTTTYSHDAMGRVTQTTDPLARVHTATYNGLGQAVTRDDPNGNDLTYEYDAANRLARVYDPATSATLGNYVTYGYDAAGHTTAASNANGTVGYGYDHAGRTISTSSPQGTVGYGYNEAGQRTAMTLPDIGGGPRVVSYGYDPGSGDLATIGDWTGGNPTEFDLTAAGQIDQIRRPNGVTTDYGYDSALRLTGMTHLNSGTNTTLAEFGYGYDANSNRTRLDVTGGAVVNGYELYEYDELNRLDSVRYPDASEVAFSYDPNGNLATVSPAGGGTTTYGYDAADQLQTVNTVDQFDYDANGNRISRATDSYRWDWANRLTGATVGGTAVDFNYLGDSTRENKTVGTTTTASTEYLWDRAGGLPMLLGDGETSVVHSGAGATEIDDATDNRQFALTDGLGSVRAETDDTGAVTGAADYDVWGAERASTTDSLFSWTGEQTDDETGLIYLWNRYSPTYIRFLSRDPVQPNAGSTQGFTPYAYARYNPATLTDELQSVCAETDGTRAASRSGEYDR